MLRRKGRDAQQHLPLQKKPQQEQQQQQQKAEISIITTERIECLEDEDQVNVEVMSREIPDRSCANSVRCEYDVNADGVRTPYMEDSASCSPCSFSFPVVEEPPPESNMEKEWMTIVGRIEVLLLEDQDEFGKIVNRRLQIICLPSDSDKVVSAFRDQLDDNVLSNDAGETRGPSVFETLASGFLECASSTCEAPRSALRKHKEKKSVGISRSVSFDRVNIHEFNMTLGDHPSAASGPPIAIDWEKKPKISSISLDEYERSREPRRHRKQLKMSMKTRCGILQREAHFSAKEITQAWENALAVRKQRRETLQGGLWRMIYDDFWESANRKYNRVSNSVTGMFL
ncbi:hypothetical protein ACA910_010741 [Epithemia clementina (nom. ined.)]